MFLHTIYNEKHLYLCSALVAGLLSWGALAAAEGVDAENGDSTSLVKAKAGSVDEEKKDPEEIFAEAEDAMNRADLKKALDLFREAALLNYTPAQVFLGEYWDYASYYEEAVGWFMTAAYQGNVAGAFGLAKMYAQGNGIAQSNEKAFFWLRFAAERNHLPAMKVMLSIYKKGMWGQKADAEQAKYWQEKIPAVAAAEKKQIQEMRARLKERADEEKKRVRMEDAAAKKRLLEEINREKN